MKRRESGQVLFEYLILLFVAVLMVLGFVYQFNDAFRQYSDAWFKGDQGGYLFCLIENGYLPGESENCTMPTFNLRNGKALSQSLGGSVNGGAGYKTSGGPTSAGGSGSGSGDGGGASGRAHEGRSGRIVPGPIFAGSGGAATGGKVDSTGNNGISSGSAPATGYDLPPSSSRSTNSGLVPFSSVLDGIGGATRSKPIPANDQDLKSFRTIAMEKAKAKKKAEEDIDSNFSFGKILKYVIIFLIVFGMLFFVGSQFFAISRSGRKRN
jgi:hypothetical protein